MAASSDSSPLFLAPSTDSVIPTDLISQPSESTPSVPLIGRSQRSSKPPLWLQDYVASAQLTSTRPLYSIDQYIGYDQFSPSNQAFLSSFGSEVEPNSFEEACKDPSWVEAMQTEISALESNQTLQVVYLTSNKRAIGCKWIINIKYHASGEIDRFKARLVAKGFN